MVPKRLSAIAQCVVALALASFSMYALAKDTFKCPDTLRVSAAALQSPDLPEGGEMAFKSDAPLPFFSMGMFSGHPREQASLVPDNERAAPAGGVSTSVWTFPGPDAYGKYAVCEYGPAGQVQIYKRMPDAARTCTATARSVRAREAAFECE
ncbi:hypothetical protein HEP73_00062 [Xanthomonas sp. GW]|nr:hypothetical protein HEP73_00062 [Xanthomonas sp. GW]